MSVSKQERRENVDLALKHFAASIGSCPIGAYVIIPHDGQYNDILQTTWMELQRNGLLRPYPGFTGCYLLTGFGLRRGLELHGMQQAKDFQDMLGKLCRCLKKFVKGRKQAAGVSVDTIASETGLPKGSIINIIEAQLLEHWFKQYGVVWASGFIGSIVLVPSDFGLEPLF